MIALPISGHGLPAVSLVRRTCGGVEGLPAVLVAWFTRRFSCPPSFWRSGGGFWVKIFKASW
jgi:hypothetical protein